MTLRLFLGLCVGLFASVAAAQPKSPTPTDLDKIAIDVLKDIHNRGAELYNTGDPGACFRMYESALITVKPFLAHRPSVQQTITTGLEEVTKSNEGVKVQAFRLHEVIEKVRGDLKAEVKKTEPAPMPKAPDPVVKPKEPPPVVKEAGLSGKVVLNGKPLVGADVMLVSLALPTPRVFVATTGADGAYKIVGAIPKGEYAVKVTGAGVPAKYQEFSTAGLKFAAADGANALDLNLMSK